MFAANSRVSESISSRSLGNTPVGVLPFTDEAGPTAIRHAAHLWTKWEPGSPEGYFHAAQMVLYSFLGEN